MKHLACFAAVSALALAACSDQDGSDMDDDAPYDTGAPEESAETTDTAEESAGPASGRTIRIVGSSTVYPFSTSVAENFGARTGIATPVVESTGTGGGMNLFCGGVGDRHPDMTGASRRMLPSEFELCGQNGVDEITEILIGYDGIVWANSVDGPDVDFTLRDIFLGLAAEVPMPVDADGEPVFGEEGELIDGRSFSDAESYSCETFIANPFETWSDVASDLPSDRIEVLGPPPTSGTRDAFVELGLHGGAEQVDCLAELAESDEDEFEAIASRIREDGAWVDSGENDNVIVQTIAQTPTQYGVFGYSFLEENSDRIKAAEIDGVAPEYDLISSGEYPISRSMYFYVKNQHVDVVPGMTQLVEEWVSEDTFGPYGYLADLGLVALSEDRREEVREQALALTPMDSPED